MTPAARFAATIELLGLVETIPRPADATVSRYFRERRFIGAKDRAAVSDSVYRLMRRRARLGWWIERSGGEVTARTLVLADLLLGGAEIQTADKLFSGGQYAPAALDRAEQALAKRLADHTFSHPDMPEAVAAECPPWAEEGLRAALGARFAVEMAALEEPAPLDLRVNPLKTDRDSALKRLADEGIRSAPTRLSPLGIRVEGRPAIASLGAYKDGWIEIQDEGSQLVSLLVGAKPGENVVDFCAGAGGKTLAMAATMENKGHVIATDVLAGRLMRARERFRRAGVHNVQARALEGESDPWIKRHKGRYDRVLVDAPCTGTGTWRRNPDMRWRPLGPGIGELAPLQARLLASAARLVKPGGRLVYATCSMLPAENQDQAEAFLAAHPDFAPVDAAAAWRESVTGSEPPSSPYLSLTPARDDTDGFFAAIFERKKARESQPGDA